MEKIRTIIIEDEVIARSVLTTYLQKYCPQITIIAEAINAQEAIEKIHALNPDLIFLDVEMPFGNGFDVISACEGYSFKTIFVTAFSDYALKALNLSASYYLLKPLNIEELVVAVNKVQAELLNHAEVNRNKVLVQNLQEPQPEKQQVILPTLEGFDVVKIQEIIRLKGNGNFTDVVLTTGKTKMVCRFLKYFEDLLPHPFMRVHKSHIINLNFVKSYNKGGFVILQDDSEIELSASYKDEFLKFFK